MSSLTREASRDGWRLRFYKDGRKSIYLGAMSKRDALVVQAHVDRLISAWRTSMPPDEDTLRWLLKVPKQLRKKITGTGIVKLEEEPDVTLKELLDQWKDSQQWKPRTVANRKQSIDRILDHFDGSRSVRSIRPGEIDDWIGWMARPKEGKKKGRGLAKSTWSKHLKDARQAFRYGVRKGYLDKDPTDHRKAPVQENKERERFITREVTTKVLEACTTRDWRRIIALARYGGLRCPSEVMRLCWSDINYEEGWFLIRSPKTEHHPGRDVRKCPIFPELWPYLVRCEDEGGKRVISSYPVEAGALGQKFNKIVERAGLKVWPKPFQNMRASRETELMSHFPIHVVCAWIGNTPAIALRHYLQVTQDDFARASVQPTDVVPYVVRAASA